MDSLLQPMNFPISGVHISPIYLIIIGFIVGILGGFFGVGGSFLAGPALFAMGMRMNFVVGTDLAHIVGKSIVATGRHRILGNIDFKLGVLMAAGTIPGAELGAQLIQALKRSDQVDFVVGIGFIVILLSISILVGWESWKTLKKHRQSTKSRKEKKDISILGHISKKVHRYHLPPMVSLPVSGVEQVSVWAILGIAFVGGLCSGFLGGGAGYIRMPMMVFLLGIPTHVAVGTDLFEIIISAGYGTVSHAMKGNVDILVALIMHTGAAVGALIGASLTEYFQGPRIRLAFVPLPLLGAALVIYSLLTGQHG
jgi:uncharacterized membrane protein YfcA